MMRLVFGPLEEHPEFAEFYEVLFFARNEAMAAQLVAEDGRVPGIEVGEPQPGVEPLGGVGGEAPAPLGPRQPRELLAEGLEVGARKLEAPAPGLAADGSAVAAAERPVEQQARERQMDRVNLELMDELRKARFGSKAPSFPFEKKTRVNL